MFENVSSQALIAMLAALYALVEVIKVLVKKLKKEDECKTEFLTLQDKEWVKARIELALKEPRDLPAEQARQIKFLHDVHDHTDDDGCFNWYVPRSWGSKLDDILKALQIMGQLDKEMISELERMQRQLERLEK
ncbi:MAG TPA: hypothetical protein ENG14_06990 [Thermodesulforhabdus norvegica]|uniref:Uncharacterized protein n=1 Tax=Thermodesulforhabdus norvegica TaxID=39841 RepID=A0A7C0WVE2_9BACT|nr:hypothetical protein [Thermodesulforhabdus norvegica]